MGRGAAAQAAKLSSDVFGEIEDLTGPRGAARFACTGIDERADLSMKAGRQTTLRDQTAVSGIGVHSGSPATLTMLPAEADTGIVFVRCGTERPAGPRNPRQRPRRHRHRIRHRSRRCHRPALLDRRACARRACGPRRRQRHHRDRRSGSADHGRQRRAVRRRDRSGRHGHAAGAAPLHPDSEAGPRRQGRLPTASCGRIRRASGSSSRSTSIIR